VTVWDGDETSDQIVARADHALYQAKQAGRNRVLPAGTGPGHGHERRLRVAADLTRPPAAAEPQNGVDPLATVVPRWPTSSRPGPAHAS
jgi:predicted signal transduction protein with EAL and GGDEF domain